VEIETTLTTESDHIRQFAFDGNDQTYFASAQNPDLTDHFMLRFEKPVSVKSVIVRTGRPRGGDVLEAGLLQGSTDGKHFKELARFSGGTAQAKPREPKLLALRIKPTAPLAHSLVIREIAVQSEPPVQVFKYPVEFVVHTDETPEMKPWADRVAALCTRAYPIINDELQSEGFHPPHLVTLTLKRPWKGKGVAHASGSQITGSADFFSKHPNDSGAFIHETVHVVQRYRGNAPGWLVEGIADYIRFFVFEPRRLGRINAAKAHYDGSYRVSAAFLAYLCNVYDPLLVRKLNKLLREGKYDPQFFKQQTGKTLAELDADWRAALERGQITTFSSR
jgi:hypothetical protein